MVRTLPALALLCLVAGVAVPARASMPLRVYCGDPEVSDVRHSDEVFVGELYKVEVLQTSRKTGRILSHYQFNDYRYQVGVVTRYRGKVRGVVEVNFHLFRSPSVREGEQYFFFVDRDETGSLRGRVCPLTAVSAAPGLLRALKARGKDLQHLLKKARSERATRLAEAKARLEEQEAWERRTRRRIFEAAAIVRSAIARDDLEEAHEVWSLRRQLERETLFDVGEARARLQAGTELPTGEETEALDAELLGALLAAARRALGAHDYRIARRRWQHALVVDPGSREAREGLAALDGQAETLFRAAELRRKTEPLLARAALREILRLTSVSNDLHTRSLRLLEAIPSD